MSDAEWELVEDIFPDKAKKTVDACGTSTQSFEFATVYFGNWLPLMRSSARRARVLAEDLAFRRKAQAQLLGAAQNEWLICWKSGAIDGSFSLRKRRCSWI